MRGESAQLIETPVGGARPAFVSLTRAESLGICLAAGHSDEESQRVAEALRGGLAGLTGPPSASALGGILRQVDEAIGPNASVAAAILVVHPRRVFGAIGGRARALLVGPEATVLGEGKGAGVGSGRVQPVVFSQPLDGHTVVLGTESMFEFAADETLFSAIRDTGAGRVAARLAEFARKRDGTLPASLALFVHRSAPAQSAPVEQATGRPRVLFAEAHSGFVRSVTRSVLRDFEVEAHGRVADALDAYTAQPFDVALVDYDLGDETGDVLVRALRERGFGGPIIAVSAKESANAGLVDAGANRACSKLAFGQIADVIRELLGIH